MFLFFLLLNCRLWIVSIFLQTQGCAVANPGDPWCLTFAPGSLEIFSFFIQIICWHPGVYRVRALGSLQFSLEHCLKTQLSDNVWVQVCSYSPVLAFSHTQGHFLSPLFTGQIKKTEISCGLVELGNPWNDLKAGLLLLTIPYDIKFSFEDLQLFIDIVLYCHWLFNQSFIHELYHF